MTLIYAKIADRTVADEYFTVSEKVEALNEVPKQLPADAEGVEMHKLRAEMHRRMLGNGYCAPHHPELWKALLPEIQGAIQRWAAGYAQLANGLGLVLRPEWSVERVSLVLQAMLDGFVLRYRVQPDDYPTSHYEGVSIFADAVIAFILGIMDWEKTGVAGRVALDGLVEPGTSEDSPKVRS